MSLSIDKIRQRTSRARDLMRRSRLEGFAVGAFNIDNQETLRRPFPRQIYSLNLAR